MDEPGSKRRLLLLPAFLYLLMALEIVVMITPFAVYFYSVYGPVLEFISGNRYLCWLADFFLPHLVFTKDPLIIGMSYLMLLFIIGLLIFIASALPLYYARIFKRDMQVGGLYRIVRHPQYLGLAVSGLGLLIYWPRFIILFLYVSMLFVYYILARNEEWRMKRKFGEKYELYMRKTSMFIPGEPGGKIYRAIFGRGPSTAPGPEGWPSPVGNLTNPSRLLLLYLILLAGSFSLAFMTRGYIEEKIPLSQGDGLAVISVLPEETGEAQALLSSILAEGRLQEVLSPEMNLIYSMPADYFLMAVVTDEPRRYSDEKAREIGPREWERRRFGEGPVRFLRIFYHYLLALGTGGPENDSAVQRFIFVSVKDRNGMPVKREKILKPGLLRLPLLLVDIDRRGRKIIEVKRASGRNKWGRAPMPAF